MQPKANLLARSRKGDEDSRLVKDGVQVPLEGVSFPPARPSLVGEQVEADVRVGAVVSERNQVPGRRETKGKKKIIKHRWGCWGKSSPWWICGVPAAVDDHDELVPL